MFFIYHIACLELMGSRWLCPWGRRIDYLCMYIIIIIIILASTPLPPPPLQNSSFYHSMAVLLISVCLVVYLDIVQALR